MDDLIDKPKRPYVMIDPDNVFNNLPNVGSGCIKMKNPFDELRFKQEKLFGNKLKKPNGLTSGLGKKQGQQGIYKGIEFDSKWEYAYYRWATDIRHWVCNRNTTESFTYRDEMGKVKKFYPDFKCNGQFVEVKGIFRANDLLKKEATFGRVEFIGPAEIKPIMKELREKIPNWLDDYTAHTHHTKLGVKKLF